MKLIVLSVDDLKKEFTEMKEEMIAFLHEKQEIRLYTINQVAKKLGMSHSTVKKLVQSGAIASTRNDRITEDSINDFLKNK